MDLYNIKKKYYSFLQKYEIAGHLHDLKNLFYFLLISWIGGSLITIINEYLFSSVKGRTLSDYLNFFFLNIKVILTTDFSDFEDLTTLTLITSIIMVVLGLVVVGLFTGEIISALMNSIEKNKYIPEKPEKFHFKNPILICGENPKVFNIINELRQNNLSKSREIILISENSDSYEIDDKMKKKYTDVYYVKGDPANSEILSNAIRKDIKNTKINRRDKLTTAIILSEKQSDEKRYSDYKAIETSLAIETFDERIHTIVEIKNNKNKFYLSNTKIDELLSINEYGVKLISQAALNNGLTNIYQSFLSASEDTNSIYFTKIIFKNDSQKQKYSYSEIKNILEKSSNFEGIILGFQKIIDLKNNFNDIDDDKKNILKRIMRSNKYFIISFNPKKKTDFRIKDIAIKQENNYFFATKDTILYKFDSIIYISNKEQIINIY